MEVIIEIHTRQCFDDSASYDNSSSDRASEVYWQFSLPLSCCVHVHVGSI